MCSSSAHRSMLLSGGEDGGEIAPESTRGGEGVVLYGIGVDEVAAAVAASSRKDGGLSARETTKGEVGRR